jgi:cell division septal protein FtsQ
MLESFDWVDTYSLAWQYPNILKVSVERKQAVAKTPNEQYISKEGFFFHLGAHQEDVPLLDMPKESIPQALMLMESMPNIASIKEHPSGTVEILYHSQNRVYLNDYEKPLYFDQILLKEKTINSKVLCDFRYKKYVNCH